MSTLVGNNSANDDYKSDVKPDQSVAPFNDAFSSISWAPTIPNVFCSSSWDGELRVFEVAQGPYGAAIMQKMSYKFPMPALKCAWNDQSTQIFVGLMDGSLKIYDINSGQVADLGRHSAAISSLHFVPGMNAVVSSGFENNIHFWQVGNPNPVMTVNAENKVFTSDFMFPMLVAGTASEKIVLVDINNAATRSVVDSVDLGKFSQIQSVAINNKCSMFGIASFDGRANLSSINKNVNGMFAPVTPPLSQKSVITFKSNKQEEAGNTILYPINSVSFNPINDRWFMTAGSDGGMHFWDYEAKNKIKSLNYGGVPICTAKVSPKGDMVAYGLGNDWHLGA